MLTPFITMHSRSMPWAQGTEHTRPGEPTPWVVFVDGSGHIVARHAVEREPPMPTSSTARVGNHGAKVAGNMRQARDVVC